jgi:serine/threonine-protein phosphatase 2A regulatory subunit A
MSPALSGEVIRDHILSMASNLATDPIPNIRFNVAKSIGSMIPILKKSNLTPALNDKVKPILIKMLEDTDVDVRFYAQASLNLI